MSDKHVVNAGDTISQIAYDHGFKNWELVWNDTANKALRDKRGEPTKIQPGDEVAIPQKTAKKLPVTPGATSAFQLSPSPPLPTFSLTMQDRVSAPFAKLEIEYRLPGAGTSKKARTDASGVMQITDASLKSGEVEIVDIVDDSASPKISYSDFIGAPLKVGRAHTMTVPNKRKVADHIATSAGVARRSTWGAAPPKKDLDPDWDYDTVVIHHSGDGGEKSAKKIQAKHFATGYDDIAYEYVVQLSGKIEEGRHIAFQSAGNSAHNTKKIAIIMAGDFEHQWWDVDDDPTPVALAAIVKLVNVLKTQFPLTRLVGHRDLPRAKGPTECPGGELYKHMGDLRTKTGLGP